MKGENWNNPVIDASTGGYVRFREHAFNIPGINFDNKVSNTDKVELKGSKGAIKAIKFKLWLWEVRFASIEGDGAKSREVTFVKIFRVALGEEESYCDVWSVNGKYDRRMQNIVDGADGRWIDEGKFEVFLCCNLIRAKVEQLVFVGEFDDGCSVMSEISDKNVTNSNCSKERFDFSKRVAGTPFADCINASWVCHASVDVVSMI